MPAKIFISYRRGDDPGSAGRLFDLLKATFEADRLFIDVDNIEPGQDFVQVIQERVAQSQVMLAVIGQHWSDAKAADGSRRLDDPADIVRLEIESALDQNKRVIPVLIGDIGMPVAADLPESLRPLTRRNAVTIRYERFRDDTARLTEALEHAFQEESGRVGRISSLVGLFQNWSAARFAIVILALALAAGAGALLYRPDATHTSESSQPAVHKGTPAADSQPAWCLGSNLKPDELRVCAAQSLWTLDNQMADLYQAVLTMSAADKRTALRQDQNTWIRDIRGGCAQDENCLLAKYQERIANLTRLKNG